MSSHPVPPSRVRMDFHIEWCRADLRRMPGLVGATGRFMAVRGVGDGVRVVEVVS